MARSLFSRLLFPLAAVAVASVALSGLFSIGVMDRLFASVTEEAYLSSASALAAAMPDSALPDINSPASPARRQLAAWCRAVSARSGYRITCILPDGTVAADSEADSGYMENHLSRPEVAAALKGAASTARRRSATVGRELFYAAAPVRAKDGGQAGRVVCALRIAAELPAIEARLGPARGGILVAMLLMAAFAVAAAALFSRRISAPLAALADASLAAARGDRSHPIPDVRGPEEITALARALSSMSSELERRVREAEEEGRERATILDGMVEAVLALDGELKVRVANSAALALFGYATGAPPLGRALLSVTRSVELEEAAEACLSGGLPIEREIAIYGEGERWFQAFVAPLISGGARKGEVIVLNDITRLRRLERVRRDFVANVSHELRTPIQLIKGFSEALMDGGLDDPERERRFVSIIAGNAARMENLISDLLTLARLEQEGESWLQCETLPVADLLKEAVDAVEPKAEAKGMAIAVSVEAGLSAEVNAGLFVQAVVNLLDNAVKYSPAASGVVLAAMRETDAPASGQATLLVTVTDHGMGIPPKDLPRLFERFYRVDKARSREQGGTGLGLAIVRHIALAHGGSVSVESAAGEGSRFSIRLPIKAAHAKPRMDGGIPGSGITS